MYVKWEDVLGRDECTAAAWERLSQEDVMNVRLQLPPTVRVSGATGQLYPQTGACF